MVFGTSFPYDYNIATLKKYGDSYKLTLHNVIRKRGFVEEKKSHKKKGTVNSDKSLNNLQRTRQAIFELSMCNNWDFFCTFTLDKLKYDRYNLSKFRTDFSQFIRNLRKKYNCDINYLFIPERHKDGAWHMHGYISGLPAQELREFSLNEKLPNYIRDKLKKGSGVFEWVTYRKKFGFCDLEIIKDKNRCSSYVTKYITKDLLQSVTELNHKSYYCSQGLKRAEEIKRGHLLQCPDKYDFENDYCKINWYNNITIKNIIDLFDNVN